MTITHIYFSPNGQTKIIADYFIDYLKGDAFDITDFQTRQSLEIVREDLVVLSFPIYSANLPDIVYEALSRVESKYMIINLTFGGMDRGNVLKEMIDFLPKVKLIGYSISPVKHAYLDHGPQVDLTQYDSLIQRVNSLKFTTIKPLIFKKRFYTHWFEKIRTNYNYRLKINHKKCNHCNQCIESCPLGAISPDLKISKDCIRCGKCVGICKSNAIYARKSLLLRTYLKKKPITETLIG